MNMHPMHPNCRCFTIPDEPDDMLSRFTRSAQTEADNWEEVPASMTWEDWRKKYVGRKDSEEQQLLTSNAKPPEQLKIDGWDKPDSIKPEPEKEIENPVKSGIISLSKEKEGALVTDYSTLGKIDRDLLGGAFGNIPTDELIITNERLTHIQERHPQDVALFQQYGAETAQNPDLIIQDCSRSGTVFMVKKLPDTNLNVVVRLSLGNDEKHPKHSVMTFYRIREKNLKKLEAKNILLYKRTGSEYNKGT